MEIVLGLLAAVALIFSGGFNAGRGVGEHDGGEEMRRKVILHCVEKPKLCKQEYDNIKTQSKLNEYERPEL